MRRLVYIAGPYASAPARNTEWARQLGKVALALGKAPIVPHVSIASGVWGRDEVPDERFAGRECSLALLRAVAASGGELWVITGDDGSMSAGTAREFSLWHTLASAKDVIVGTRDEWRNRAAHLGLGLLPPKVTGQASRGVRCT